ncbi:hypothetical protein CR194_03795 [Salipaludibacillus keqinensis]|uniref:DUF1861 domain-containing protein n=1 Tax=Salipaludibacillus keqinensis TaxID=2045207 RepID=A0A323TQ55_9BACI|nr:DUF1861 family protein [Salipaludibacillus keqinensis]PYZ94663.1 hypothetical protein CR194_03795 [Salipaludibacillus keqinensis]
MIKLTKGEVKTCSVLVEEFKKNPENPEKITFSGVGNKDVYNITAPFEDEGEQVIAGRVEDRDSEHSEVHFFVEVNGEWKPRQGAPVFSLQDPFVTKVAGERILGGVEIFPHPTIKDGLGWRTVFYKGDRLATLTPFFKGPDGMKDVRIVELPNGEIGIFTRPQGEKGGRGEIGFAKVASLSELTVEVINDAPLLEGQFIKEEWGGANEIHVLSNGLLGVLGHIACFDEAGDRHYYPMVFAVNPENHQFSDLQIIATRADFLPGESKRPDLASVVFSGGLVRKSNGKAELYSGISDAEAQNIVIEDPFSQYEQ